MAVIAGVALLASPGAAKDYVVRFVAETYKSAPADAGSAAKVYHTWAVETDFGKKLLVLKGDDPLRREWLREFSKDHQQFLVKVSEVQTGTFELDTVVDIAVEDLHPISPEFTEEADKGKKGGRGGKK
jgi:hypothetical protein